MESGGQGFNGQAVKLNGGYPFLREQLRLSEKTVTHFGCGFCTQGEMKDFVVAPVHDNNGKPCGNVGKRPHNVSGFEPYVYSEGVNPRKGVFNLHRLPSNAKTIMIVPDFFLVMQLYELGYRNVVGLLGTPFSRDHASLLVRRSNDFRIPYIRQEDFQSIERTLRQVLPPKAAMNFVPCSSGLDPSNLTPRERNRIYGAPCAT